MLLAAMMTLTVAAAVPAAVQDAAPPQWLLGNWCLKRPPIHQCIRFEIAEEGFTLSVIYPDAKKESRIGSEGWMRVVAGRLVSHSDGAGTTYAEVSRGPGDLLLERVEGSGAKAIRYRVEGDTLTVTFDTGRGETSQLYRLER